MSGFPNCWLALGTDATQDGLGEPVDPGYARQAISFTPLTPGAPCASLASAVFGPAVAAWPPVTCMGLFQSQTGGAGASAWWALPQAVTVAAGGSWTASAGTVQLRFIDASDLLVRGTVELQPGSVFALSADSLPVMANISTSFSVAQAWGSAAPGDEVLTDQPLSDAERTDVRRFCGYPAYGNGASGFQSWRFFQAYGTLEYRLTNLAPAELVVVRTYLGTLTTLEAAIPAAGANLDTASAAVWTHNPNEVRDRTALFTDWRTRLADFIGLPFAPSRASAGAIII